MSTQIFINPNTCKPEFTKIAGHSLYLTPSMNKTLDPNEGLFFGDKGLPIEGALWSGLSYSAQNSIISPIVRPANIGLGVPLPINLVPDDVVTISGSAYLNSYNIWTEANFTIDFVLGVFYFNCEDTSDLDAPAYTFIPVQSFTYDSKSGTVCFEASVTLGSSYDIHNTRFLVGFNTFATCNGPEQCIQPIQDDKVTVSYTMDIQRPCAATITNFIIRNCCEPIITELVNIPGLTIGSFHVDDEGNCWEVISASNDVTNFTRNFVDIYTSCLECQTANPCPDNLKIESCCVQGQEYVTGSLPGLDVGDTFVDNYGLCWVVSDTTGAPLSEESITVDTEIIGDCTVCTDANPCPDFWYVKSCCNAAITEIIATSVPLNPYDSFVDTNGICWGVGQPATSLPTNYNIVVDTVYPGPDAIACDSCIIANPCPTEYFITVRACCDNDRVEVISVPSQYMSFSEGIIFNDQYNLCWEVMSYSTTGVETYSINWDSFFAGTYKDCKECVENNCKDPFGSKECACKTLWEVQLCGTSVTYIAYASGVLDVGSIYQGQNFTSTAIECFEVLGYGYPTGGEIEVEIDPHQVSFATCEECNTPAEPTFREVTLCNTGETITVLITGPNVLSGTITQLYLANTFNPMMSGTYCVTMGGVGTPQPPLWTCTIPGGIALYISCEECLLTSPVMKRVRLTACCSANDFVMDTDLVFPYGVNGTYAISLSLMGAIECYTVSLTTDPELPYSPTIDTSYPNFCDTNCINDYC